MANILLKPVLTSDITSPSTTAPKKVAEPGKNSFNEYIEREVKAESPQRNQLGEQKGETVDSSQPSTPAEQSTQQVPESSQRSVTQPKSEASLVEEGAYPDDETILSLLAQLMSQLQEMADDPKTGPGQWEVSGEEIFNFLEKIAGSTGMSQEDMNALKLQADEQGSLGLADLFAALQSHFAQMDTEVEVLAPETDLPLLESLLVKLGLPAEQVEGLAEESVTGTGQFDLNLFLDGLSGIDLEELAEQSGGVETTVTLSDWEVEQLQSLFSEVGVSEETIEGLFPEKIALWQKALADQNPDEGDQPVTINFERLQNMLEQAIADLESQAPELDPPAFLVELDSLLQQAGFTEESVGWTPVLQESVTSMYKELLKAVDLSEVSVARTPVDVEESGSILNRLLLGEEMEVASRQSDSGQNNLKVHDLVAGEKDKVKVHQVAGPTRPQVDLSGLESRQAGVIGTGEGDEAKEIFFGPRDSKSPWADEFGASAVNRRYIEAKGEARSEEVMIKNEVVAKEMITAVTRSRVSATLPLDGFIAEDAVLLQQMTVETVVEEVSATTLFMDTMNSSGVPVSESTPQLTPLPEDPSLTQPQQTPRLRTELKQLTFEQISNNVLQGLKDQRHHLTLTLYPKDLGEVKVDMQVKDNHVSLTFLMDNSRVKEVLESSMDEFKENMERQGFVLEQCDVSVDQQDQSEDQRQMFELAWQKNLKENGKNVPDGMEEEILSQAVLQSPSRHGGSISLMV